jgi:hypothetical protein
MGAYIRTFLLLTDKNAAHYKNISHTHKSCVFPINSINQVLPLDTGIIHSSAMTEIRAFKMVTVTEDRLLQDAAHIILLCTVLYAFHSRRLEADNSSSTIKNCFANCGFPSDHISSNNYIPTDWR